MMKTSWKHYLAWTEWLRRQWNEPDRHDSYVMKLIHCVRHLFNSKKHPPIESEKIEVTWKKLGEEEAESEGSIAWKTEMAHVMIRARLGINAKGEQVVFSPQQIEARKKAEQK